MPTYRAFQVTGQRQFELVDRELVAPSPVMSGSKFKAAVFATATYSVLRACVPTPASRSCPAPRSSASSTPSDGVTTWQVGDRVGLGYLGGHDATCDWCRRGDFVNCENSHKRAPP